MGIEMPVAAAVIFLVQELGAICLKKSLGITGIFQVTDHMAILNLFHKYLKLTHTSVCLIRNFTIISVSTNGWSVECRAR